MDVMFNIFRHLVVASLLAGMGAAGLPPCLVAGGNCQLVTAQHKAKSCCCHGKCGAHCRMACCQSPSPTQDRAPAPTRVTDDTSVTFGLAANAAAQLPAAAAASFRRGVSPCGICLAALDSLLDLSIRLNV